MPTTSLLPATIDATNPPKPPDRTSVVQTAVRTADQYRAQEGGKPVATACRHSQPLAARLGSRRRTVYRRSAPSNDRRRSFTFSHRGFANASTDANGKNNRANCNQEFFHWAPLSCTISPRCLYRPANPLWLYFGNILTAS